LGTIWLCAAAINPAYGQQNVSFLRTGSIEAGVFGGASYGNVNYEYMFGGNLTIAANKWILPYVEYTYLPQVQGLNNVNATLAPGQTVTASRNISFSDFHGGIHIRLPIHESPVVPYLVIGAGVLHHFPQTITETITDLPGTTTPVPPPSSFTVAGGSDFAVNFGGGIRYYLRSERFGFRAEAKVYKPTGDFKNTFGKVEFGIFYQFR